MTPGTIPYSRAGLERLAAALNIHSGLIGMNPVTNSIEVSRIIIDKKDTAATDDEMQTLAAEEEE